MLDAQVGDVRRDELYFASGVVARAMRDNPNHVAAFGSDPDTRLRVNYNLFEAVVPAMPTPPICVRHRDTIVGIAGMAAPGACQMHLSERLRMMPRFLGIGPGRAMRAMTWMRDWARRDLKERHWHLGPVGVELALQGLGLGSKMLATFAERMDAAREVAYLETDRKENVPFYEKAGFRVIDEGMVLGTPNWFMRRDPS